MHKADLRFGGQRRSSHARFGVESIALWAPCRVAAAGCLFLLDSGCWPPGFVGREAKRTVFRVSMGQ